MSRICSISSTGTTCPQWSFFCCSTTAGKSASRRFGFSGEHAVEHRGLVAHDVLEVAEELRHELLSLFVEQLFAVVLGLQVPLLAFAVLDAELAHVTSPLNEGGSVYGGRIRLLRRWGQQDARGVVGPRLETIGIRSQYCPGLPGMLSSGYRPGGIDPRKMLFLVARMSGQPHLDSGSHGLAYQPALDGLRALAVAAVLAYHADLPWARGGFLGVDAFFVLSGFLITSLLLNEWRRSGTDRPAGVLVAQGPTPAAGAVPDARRRGRVRRRVRRAAGAGEDPRRRPGNARLRGQLAAGLQRAVVLRPLLDALAAATYVVAGNRRAVLPGLAAAPACSSCESGASRCEPSSSCRWR